MGSSAYKAKGLVYMSIHMPIRMPGDTPSHIGIGPHRYSLDVQGHVHKHTQCMHAHMQNACSMRMAHMHAAACVRHASRMRGAGM